MARDFAPLPIININQIKDNALIQMQPIMKYRSRYNNKRVDVNVPRNKNAKIAKSKEDKKNGERDKT